MGKKKKSFDLCQTAAVAQAEMIDGVCRDTKPPSPPSISNKKFLKCTYCVDKCLQGNISLK